MQKSIAKFYALPNDGSSWYFERKVCRNREHSNWCVCFQHKEYELEKSGGGEMSLIASEINDYSTISHFTVSHMSAGI